MTQFHELPSEFVLGLVFLFIQWKYNGKLEKHTDFFKLDNTPDIAGLSGKFSDFVQIHNEILTVTHQTGFFLLVFSGIKKNRKVLTKGSCEFGNMTDCVEKPLN